MKKIIILILSFYTLINSFPQDFTGVFINRSPKFVNPSSILIQDLQLLDEVKEININFEMEFLTPFSYGNIFHLYSKNEKLLSIVYSPYQINHKEGFILSIPSYNFSKSIPQRLGKSLYNRFHFRINVSRDSLSLKLDENEIEFHKNDLFDLHDYIKLYFGATPNKPEVTNSILRNITFNQSNGNRLSLIHI